MSKVVKSVAKIALPVVGTIIAPGIGTALGSSLAASTLATIGGVVGGAAGGAIGGGGLKGAALGAVGGYLTAGAVGLPAGTPVAEVAGNAALQGPSIGSGLSGAVTGGGTRALTAGISQAATSVLDDPSKLLTVAGNQVIAQSNADTALEAAQTQSDAIDRGISANQAANAPYTQLGQEATQRIQDIQSDRAGYIQNNELYQSLAQDAERRLLANQAAKGKVGSGGTAAALQEQLLSLGNGLVNQEINTLQNQANTGASAAANVGSGTANLLAAQGDVNAAGQIASNQAISNGYQNQINTLLALKGLDKAPVYSPTLNL